MKRFIRSGAVVLTLTVAACGGDGAELDDEEMAAEEMAEPTAEARDLIQLPEGFAPEGIAVSDDGEFFVGSMSGEMAGQILTGDVQSGEVRELVAANGMPALGIRHDAASNLIYVAGGGSGGGRVYDAATGAEVASFSFANSGAMINDVEVTPDAAYFTDSQLPSLYRVALEGGQPGDWEAIDLPAIFSEAGTACSGAPPIRGNGIASTPDGRYVIINHMSEGTIYRLDTQSGEIEQIELTGGDLCSADGLLLDGNTLYAVQNMMNRVAVVEMGDDFLSGNVTGHITEPFASNPNTRIPTTIGHNGDSLYAVTAGFADPAPDYIVRMDKMP